MKEVMKKARQRKSRKDKGRGRKTRAMEGVSDINKAEKSRYKAGVRKGGGGKKQAE